MNLLPIRIIPLILLLACVVASQTPEELMAQGAPSSTDEIIYLPDTRNKKEETIKGQIQEESPGGIKVKTEKGEVRTIPALNVVWITYKTGAVNPSTFREGHIKENRAALATKTSEKKALLTEALNKFLALAPQVIDPPNAQRFIDWKIADVRVRLAELEPANKLAIKSAIEALSSYGQKNSNGWEIVPCMVALSQLLEQEGNFDGARKAHETLSRLLGAPPELKKESEMMVLQLLLRARQFADAEKRAQEISKSLSPSDPRAGLIALYLIESQIGLARLDGVEDSLKKTIQSSGDNRIKALAHCLLGDYYRSKKQDESALWEYLKVDVLYPQDREEEARALYWLVRLYESVQGSKVRANQSRDRLLDKQFNGTEYQKKALADKPATP